MFKPCAVVNVEALLFALGDAVGENYMGASIPGYDRISDSTEHLRQNIHRSPQVLPP